MGSWTKQMGFPIIVVDQEQVRFTWIDSATRMKLVFYISAFTGVERKNLHTLKLVFFLLAR